MAKSEKDGINRRGALDCMIWAGTGVLWTMVGGVQRSSSLLSMSEANAQAMSGFTFLQISDSHIGFKQPANPNPLTTLEEAIGKISSLQQKPAFMLHTGDITHLSKSEEFDNADQAIKKSNLETFYVPGEHDIIDERQGQAYLERYGKRVEAKGTGWYSFDQKGVHFVGPVNVADLKAGGMGTLGAEQLAWLADDLKAKGDSTPIVHIPLWTVDANWGWGTEELGQTLRLGDGAQRAHPSVDAKGRRCRDLPHRSVNGISPASARHCEIARAHESPGRPAAQRARDYIGCREARYAAVGNHRQRTRQRMITSCSRHGGSRKR